MCCALKRKVTQRGLCPQSKVESPKSKVAARHLPAVLLLVISLGACGAPSAQLRAYQHCDERYDVEIRRDNFGVPHIYGKRDADVAFGLAYAHAEDDFATIQETLLTARGQLASLNGRAAAPTDYLVGLLGARKLVAARYMLDLSPAVRAVLEAYAEGLNYYAATHPGQIRGRFEPATGEDIVTGFVLTSPLFFGLDRELMKLFAPAPPVAVPPATNASGSNGFAIAPWRSTDGYTRLLANSHQPWSGPVAWYEARLHSEEGWDVEGQVFPGSPFVLIGHNRQLGWTNTVNRPDLVDIYRLDINPSNPDQYRLDGQWRDFEKGTVRIRVKLWGPFFWTVSREILRSVHGPVLQTPRGTFAIRYAGIGDIRQVEQYYRLDKATSFSEFLDVMRLQAIAATNFIYADASGNIAFFYNARFPERQPGLDWRGYLPGDRSDLIWRRYVPFDRVPMVINPPSGFVFNANNTPFHVTGEGDNPRARDYPAEWGVEPYMNNRAWRASELLESEPKISRETLLADKFDLQYGEHAAVREAVRTVLAANAAGDPILVEAQAVLQQWDFRANRDNRSAALGVMLAAPLSRAQFRDEPPPDPLPIVRDAAAYLRKHFGRVDVPLGQVQRLIRGAVNLPLDGGPDVLRAIRGTRDGAGHIIADDGDGMILLVEWDSSGRVRSQSVHQFGSATSVPGSPHFSDQAPLFAEMRLKPVWFEEQELLQHLSERYRPGKRQAQCANMVDRNMRK
jgi:acyl-homoserine-lactone acylase